LGLAVDSIFLYSLVNIKSPALMMSPEVLQQWQKRLETASSRWREAGVRVLETTLERLMLPARDGYLAHKEAAQAETEALKEYKRLLTEFARSQNGVNRPHRFQPPSGSECS